MQVPVRQRWFEDYPVGERFEVGDYPITEREIVEFATRYDPQPFHVDPVAAQAGPFGGLIASGWMTAGILMRLLVDHFISPLSSLGSPGIDELRWTKPVRPGDRLHVRVRVLQLRRSVSKPDRGLMQLQQEVVDQHGDTVMTVRGWGLYRSRSAVAPGPGS